MHEVEAPNVQSRWLGLDGVRVHYQYRPGSGPTLVLLPGGVFDSSTLSWKKLLEALPVQYRAFCPELPGYGDSGRPDRPYSTAYYVGFVECFFEAMGIERAGVLGSSMSGAVTLGFALAHPERVAQLVLSGAFGLQPRVPLHEAAYALSRVPGMGALAGRLLGLHPRVMRAVLRLAVRNPHRITDELVADAFKGTQHPRALAPFQRWLQSELLPHRVRTDFSDRLGELDLPVLLLHGAYDWVMPPACIREAARRLPNAEFHLLPTGHLVPRERPVLVNRLILRFLGKWT